MTYSLRLGLLLLDALELFIENVGVDAVALEFAQEVRVLQPAVPRRVVVESGRTNTNQSNTLRNNTHVCSTNMRFK